jgi:hypothetical protein
MAMTAAATGPKTFIKGASQDYNDGIKEGFDYYTMMKRKPHRQYEPGGP